MSFLKRLFGRSVADSAPASEPVRLYRGFEVRPEPIEEGGQYRLAALIGKEIDGEMRSHRLIRADLFPTAQEATAAAVRKAERVIDEQGDALLQK